MFFFSGFYLHRAFYIFFKYFICPDRNYSLLRIYWIEWIYIYIYIRSIGLVVRVFADSLGDRGSIPDRVIPKTFKMVLDTPLLSNIRYASRVKWSNQEKGVAPSPTPQCSSYWKESLLVAIDYVRQLYFHICVRVCVRVCVCVCVSFKKF